MTHQNQCIAVLAGGSNEERNLSLQGGQDVYDVLRKKHENVKFIDWTPSVKLPSLLNGIDVCFNCLHGTKGEDGTVAGLLEVLEIPYTFSGLFGSACGSDKSKTKELLSGKDDIMLVLGRHVRMSEWNVEDSCPVTFPVMVKDPSQGSSKGVWLCKEQGEFVNAMSNVSGTEALIEKFIPGVDIVVCLLRDANGLTVWPVMEFETELEWQDNESKNALWGWEGGESSTPKVLKHCPPKNLALDVQAKAVAMAKSIYGYLRARSALNVEFRVSGTDVYFIEVSIIPAMTSTSVHATCAQAAGVSFDQLVQRLLGTADLDVRSIRAKL